MKNYLIFLSVLATLFTITSCVKDKCSATITYYYYKPVYVTPEQYRIPVSLAEPLPIKEAGKIYFYNNYILINEVRKGLHLIDNTNPTNPVNMGFITILGNVDMAIMNGILYADSYSDLVIIDLRDPLLPKLLERKENVFEGHYFNAGSNRIISHYEKTGITDVLDCSSANYGSPFYYLEDKLFAAESQGAGFSPNSNGAPVIGQGGSLARMTISKNHLYIVGESEINALPILESGLTGSAQNVTLPWGVETIFPFKDYLFIGANNGLHIMDLKNPSKPHLNSSFTHARGCDPVVVDDDVAYVTLRSGPDACPGDKNELQVIDVKDVFNPKLMYTYGMVNPHGLGYWKDKLFICEGDHGLKIFDKSDNSKINKNLLAHLNTIQARDVIAIKEDLLLVIGQNAFLQYDFTDTNNIKLLSRIDIQP